MHSSRPMHETKYPTTGYRDNTRLKILSKMSERYDKRPLRFRIKN